MLNILSQSLFCTRTCSIYTYQQESKKYEKVKKTRSATDFNKTLHTILSSEQKLMLEYENIPQPHLLIQHLFQNVLHPLGLKKIIVDVMYFPTCCLFLRPFTCSNRKIKLSPNVL